MRSDSTPVEGNKEKRTASPVCGIIAEKTLDPSVTLGAERGSHALRREGELVRSLGLLCS